ncbi:Solute carrier family 35 member E3 [Monoraphidium neglectum]|uniref:Solute carrier family 35 member E3 n=1 Tax=Monoraphidium neglectum TaxID=145388 RepID=A0A0D2MQG7_9CHLO|nr:Solute carrier family 35 member E3 [Monoraphidium neglectum]KIY96905.1 Solute carrier family 35 member E3 [Monoraphidium neglectum]|eukprot:XP_013895925.1 Solute carrier family 35 member E3 [Monoraphidium neglectum]
METGMFKKTDSRGTHSSTTASDDPEKQTEPLLPRDLPRTDGASSGGGTGALVDAGGPRGVPQWVLTVSYGLTNLSSVVMIVVANKMVLYTCKFSFVVTLTLLHSVFTYVGMGLMAMLGLFPVKAVAARHSVQIAAVYVGFIVTNNLSSFYQLSKLLITPVVVAIEWVFYKKTVSRSVMAAIAILMVGITLCTVTDSQVSSNPAGMAAAAAAVIVASLYQVWAGTKQKELGLNGMQLLQQVSPYSVLLLLVLVPVVEPVGWYDPKQGTILGYVFTPAAVAWIAASSALGLVVTLSTFLFIGATSSLTYNVVGHLKTLLIVAAGVLFFGEELGLKKGVGLATALGGIGWYSHIRILEAQKPAPSGSKA